MKKFRIYFLDEEPEPKSWYKQLFYCFTRPFAELFDGFNIIKLQKIARRRREIADMQKRDFITYLAELLYEKVLAQGQPTDERLCKLLCIDEAIDIFYEKKMNGCFDDLNIMTK